MLRRNGMDVAVVRKHFQGPDNVVDAIRAGRIDLVINTPYGHSGTRTDGYEIRTAAVAADIPCITTVAGAAAAIQGIEALIRSGVSVAPLQELQAKLRAGRGDGADVAGTAPGASDGGGGTGGAARGAAGRDEGSGDRTGGDGTGGIGGDAAGPAPDGAMPVGARGGAPEAVTG
jgi:hypothetical protein